MTTYYQADEAYVVAVVNQLNANLPAAITAIDAQRNDGILIGNNVQVLDWVPTPKQLNHFPTVAVRTGPAQLGDDTGGGGTWEGRIVIAVFVQDADQRSLTKRLQRLTEAVCNVAYPRERAYSDLSSPIWGMRGLHTEPGPTLSRNENPQDWMSFNAIGFDVRGEADQSGGG